MVQIRDDHIRFISELARYSNSEVSSLWLRGRGPRGLRVRRGDDQLGRK